MKKILFACLVGLLSQASAQEAVTLSWEDVRRLAMEHNPDIIAAKASVSQAGYNYLASLNSYMPQIGFSHSLSRSGSDGSSPSSRWGASFSASEVLLDFKTISSVKSERISKEKAEADYLSASASLRQRLASAFIDLLFAQRKIEVQEKILRIRKENARLIRLKYESGMESKGNALYTEALAENAAVSAKRAERQLDSAKRSLLTIIGTDIKGGLKGVGDIKLPEFSIDQERISRALSVSPAIVSAAKTLEGAKQRYLSARYYAYPSLKASQSYGWSGDHEFPDGKSWSVGVSLSIPLFSGGPTYYFNSLSASKKGLRAAEENFRSEKISLEESLRSGYDDFLSSVETASSSVLLLRANEERYKEAQIKYMAGKISFIDLENVEQNFVDSELNQLDYNRAAYSRKFSLEQLLGIGIEERTL